MAREADNFEKLLEQGDSGLENSTSALWTGSFHDPGSDAENHGTTCDTSCNRCLRDFYNLPYHGLLDWRLALDMAHMVASPSAVISLNQGPSGQLNNWSILLEGADAPVPATMKRLGYMDPVRFGNLRGYVHQHRPYLWIERHPLWTDEHLDYVDAVNVAGQLHPNHSVQPMNPFIVIRRPADYV